MTERLHLSRAQLAAFLKDPQAIKQFEELFKAANQVVPDDIMDTAIAAESARVSSQQALDSLGRLTDALEMLALAPRHEPVLSSGLSQSQVFTLGLGA